MTSNPNSNQPLPDITEMDDASSLDPLYENDTGELPMAVRRVLVHLLRGPALEERRHTELWPTLLQNETVVRRRLCDLFLDLALDRERGVAFLRQAVSEEFSIPILLRKAKLTLLDSALLLHLRELLAQADSRAERAAVSMKDLREHLNLYERVLNTDHAGFARRVKASLDKMKKYGILRDLDRDNDRKEISPTLRLLFDTGVISNLLKTYRALLEGRDAIVLDNEDQESEMEGD